MRTSPEIDIVRRVIAPGRCVHQVASHVLRVQASAPMRVACHGERRRLVRAPGQLDLLPAGGREAWREHDRGVVLELTLPPALVAEAARDLEAPAALVPRFHFFDACVAELAWALEAERRDGFPSGRLYRDGIGRALIGRLLARPAPPPAGGLTAAQRERVFALVEAELGGDLSLGRLARAAGVSASHFKVLFKRAVGLAPHAYVIRRRVERARALLGDGDLGLAAIAVETGFAHQSHLARWMRRLLGVSPAELRRRGVSA